MSSTIIAVTYVVRSLEFGLLCKRSIEKHNIKAIYDLLMPHLKHVSSLNVICYLIMLVYYEPSVFSLLAVICFANCCRYVICNICYLMCLPLIWSHFYSYLFYDLFVNSIHCVESTPLHHVGQCSNCPKRSGGQAASAQNFLGRVLGGSYGEMGGQMEKWGSDSSAPSAIQALVLACIENYMQKTSCVDFRFVMKLFYILQISYWLAAIPLAFFTEMNNVNILTMKTLILNLHSV